MSDPAPFHILLVYPPVASPAAPPGISAYVAGHLAGFGLSLNHYDANLDFFLNSILNPQTLADLLERIEKGKRQGRFNEFDSETAAFLDDLAANHDIWERKIAGLPHSLEILRGEDFYQPNSCMSALKDIKDLLALGSLAFYPSRIELHRFSRFLARFCMFPGERPCGFSISDS